MAQNPRRKTQNGICGSFCRVLNAVKAPLPNLSYLEPAGETGVLLPFRTKSNPPRTLRSSRGVCGVAIQDTAFGKSIRTGDLIREKVIHL